MSVATFLLVVFFLTQTISLPFLNNAFADAPDRPNLLSILVSDRIFKGSIEAAVVNYAKNVEKTNPDIRRLAYTLIVGDVPLPVVKSEE